MIDQELSEEDLKIFLDDIGVFKSEESSRIDASPLEVSFKEEKRKRYLLPIWFSLAILGGIFMGTVFGYFLGKTEQIQTVPIQKIEALDEKLSSLIEQLNEVYEKPPLNQVFPEEEIIEPISPKKLFLAHISVDT